jgi:hypothetical protein
MALIKFVFMVWLNSKVQSTAVSFLFIKTGIGLQTATKNNIKAMRRFILFCLLYWYFVAKIQNIVT